MHALHLESPSGILGVQGLEEIMTKTEKNRIIAEYATKPGDTGSPEVQVAILTHRINELTEHFKTHIHDYHSYRGLMKMVARRKSLLAYLQRNDYDRYKALIARLGLRK